MTLWLVQPHDLHRAWPMVSPGVKTCLRNDPGEGTWPEDVYACLAAGMASLHVGLGHGHYYGFVVTQMAQSRWTHEPYLHLWLCFNEGGFSVLDRGQAQLERYAKEQGCQYMTSRVARSGLERLTGQLGYNLVAIEVRKDL